MILALNQRDVKICIPTQRIDKKSSTELKRLE
jgi:hypothetical protein